MYTNLEMVKDVWARDLDLIVLNIQMVFKAMRLDEITQEDEEFKGLHPGELQSLQGHQGKKSKANGKEMASGEGGTPREWTVLKTK